MQKPFTFGEESTYDALIESLAELVDQAISSGPRRYIVKKPKFDADAWLRRQMLRETYQEMDDYLTAELLGTTRYVRLA